MESMDEVRTTVEVFGDDPVPVRNCYRFVSRYRGLTDTFAIKHIREFITREYPADGFAGEMLRAFGKRVDTPSVTYIAQHLQRCALKALRGDFSETTTCPL